MHTNEGILENITMRTYREEFTHRELMVGFVKAKRDFKLTGRMISESTGIDTATVSTYMVIGESSLSENFAKFLDDGAALRAVGELARLAKKYPIVVEEKVNAISYDILTLDFVSQLKYTLEGGGGKSMKSGKHRVYKVADIDGGVLFNQDDERTYPPEYTFVVINLLPNVPVYYERKSNTWLTAIADKNVSDIYSKNDLFYLDINEVDLYWQPIVFKMPQNR